jgi:nucleoside-diphosphate-sugar epimerase
MRILLLGGNGLLGNNVLRQLLRCGHSVCAVVRKKKALCLDDLSEEEIERITFIEGSFLIPSVLEAAATECDAIVNCAGTTNMRLLHYEDYLPVNCNACSLIISAMQHCGIHRLVHVSTANTIGYGTPNETANEHRPMQLPFSESYYAMSKKEGEKILTDYAAGHPDDHIVIVNPGFMIGPYDMKPSSGQLLLAAYRKPIMVCPAGGKSFLDVRDAAIAITNAIYHGTNGQRYLLTGENMTLKQFYLLQARVLHYRQLLICLPNSLALCAAKVGDLLRFCGVTTQLSTRNVRQLLVREYYDNSLAIRDLGLPQTPPEVAIRDFFDNHNANRTQRQ